MTTSQNTPQRKYRMTRLRKGDYLLLGNQGDTWFRLSTYEDGPSHGIDDMPKDRMFWGVWRWPGTKDSLMGEVHSWDDPFEDWDRWYQIESWCDTRQEAIDAALRWEAKR